MLGIIIGVVSVITTISLGEGIKQRIVGQITQSGPNLITIRPGRMVTRDDKGKIKNVNVLSNFSFGSLSEADFQTIKTTPGIQEAVPFANVSGIPQKDGREYTNGPLIATDSGAAKLLNQDLEYGAFFASGDEEKNVAVIGMRVAEQLFQENVPVGKSFTVRDQTFVVRGVFKEFTTSPLVINADYNYAIFIPYASGKHISGGQQQIYQVLAKPNDTTSNDLALRSVTASLTKAHAGQTDFTVLTQDESLAVANSVLNLLTSFIAGIAAISLIVGGIGIMNIMLLAVTERTREIGVRMAIGATSRQIRGQFLIEAVLLSFTGGVIGIIIALLVNYLLRIFTDLTPVITFPIIGISAGVSILVGIIFGITPALKAARKDPIEALRHE